MTPPEWLHFFRRAFPSANMVLVRGPRPLLIDTGFGSELAETERLLQEAGVPPERLHLIVNTHYHSDHVGGNSGLQRRYGLPIAAHRWEADLINRRDREACAAEWLDQPVEPYEVQLPLSDGDELDSGTTRLQVLHLPGHTLGQIGLYAPEAGGLICGDAFHGNDVAWINIFREGVGALQRAMESLDRLAALPLRWACSGHGAAIAEPIGAIDAARRRYERWLDRPESIGWHGCKRIFAYALMLAGGLPEEEVAPYLLRCAWFQDFSRHLFALDPPAFVQPLVEEMVRSRAAGWREGRLVALTPHRPLPTTWRPEWVRPVHWPPPQGTG